ncbi:MAG: toprim domain-containing protein [Arcobacteraceae bacterium]|nr:toprim domain-containing protein [Arcobacteraceae bacterium]
MNLKRLKDKIMQTDLFELVKNANLDIKEFISTHYNFEWKRNKTVCPFHGDDEKSPNFSYAPKLNIVKCMVCEQGGDLINFIVAYKKITKLQACIEILDFENISYDRPDETTVETKEEREKRQKEFKENQAKNEKRKIAKEKELQKDKDKAIVTMTKDSKLHAKNLDLFTHHKELGELVYNQSDTFAHWLKLYLGYDTKHQTICILNRLNDNAKTTFNIKHRLKYEWDDKQKQHTNIRKAGKWLSTYDSTTYPFPYDYFQYASALDEVVFLTEGEKDALNLLSYDINVLTLGGVSTSWEDHKEILKDKIVYIWFDNDNAGYKGAINQYNAIKDIVKEVYIVLFFEINPSLPNKYDINDFIKDKKFKNKAEILHSIGYSSFKLTTAVVENIEHYTSLDLRDYYCIEPIKTIQDIKKYWLKQDSDHQPINIVRANGQKDIKGLNEFIQYFKDEKKYKNFHKITVEQIALNLINIDDGAREEKSLELVELMKNLALNYEDLHKDYSQTHISDMVEAFEIMSKKTDNTFAKYGSVLSIWTGTYYQILENHDDFNRFVLKGWMPKARVDKKKRSSENVDKILKDVYVGAVSLDEIKHYSQKGKRVINFTNGTLFITSKGKVTFKNIHDKKDACTNILKFEYDTKAVCPKWTKFLNRNIPNKDDQATLMEFIGYCFLPAHNYEAFLYLYGADGANGKSVIIDTIKEFFGKDNTSALDLQNLKGHELEGLTNKLVNVGSELDTKNLRDGQMNVLKKLTSTKDDLQIDPKHTKGFLLTSENQPKMISAGNGELNPSTLDGGVLRRALQINCDIVIEDDEKVRALSDRFEDEMNGILNLALQSLGNLIRNGKFTKSEKLKETIENYKDQANPIRRYINDCLELDEEVIIPKDFLYAHYKEYMKEKGSMPLSQPKFFNKIYTQLKKVQDIGQQRVNVEDIAKDRPRFIQGVFCNSNDVYSFDLEKKQVKTENINYDLKLKTVVVKDDDINTKQQVMNYEQ